MNIYSMPEIIAPTPAAVQFIQENGVVHKTFATYREAVSTPEGRARMAQAQTRKRLKFFVAKTFKTLHPEDEYNHNWHLDVLTEYLEACYRREIKRLIINVPPRTLKSISGTIAFPAWAMGKNPSLKFMCGSYSQTLSFAHSLDTRRIMESPWYKNAFPGVGFSKDENTMKRFRTTKGGHRIATSTGAATIGEGADFLIADDPMNSAQANSDAERAKANTWFQQAFMSRLNDRKNGVVIVIMQRLHEMDTTGMLLAQGGWEHLCLPDRAPETKLYHFGKMKAREWKKGEVLFKKRLPEEVLKAAKVELGSYGYAGQYEQRPAPLGGGMVKLSWFKRYNSEVLPVFTEVWHSMDTGTKAAELNDPSTCLKFGVNENGYYIFGAWNERLEYPDLKRKTILHASAEKKLTGLLLEDKGSGQQLIQDLRRETKLPVIAFEPEGDKVTRLAGQSAVIEAGRVHLPEPTPENAAWLAEFEKQIMLFPAAGLHDEFPDCLSQFLKKIRERENNFFRIRRL